MSDLFLKHIPEAKRPTKTGMNILVLSDYNVADQPRLIFKYINSHTIHKARLVVVRDDYLAYGKDLIVSDETRDEIVQLVKEADFFHIGRTTDVFRTVGLNWIDWLKPTNSLIQYWGSEIRDHVREIWGWHIQNAIHGLSAWDATMLDPRGLLYYHIPLMLNTESHMPCDPADGTIRIAHDTTNRKLKNTELFISVCEELKKRLPFDYTIIEGKSNAECLAIKQKHQMLFAEIGPYGCYGMSVMEAMSMGLLVFTGMDNFAMSFYPNSPIVPVTEKTLSEKIEFYVNDRFKVEALGNAGIDWVDDHHNPKTIVQQYAHFYDFIKNGRRLV